MTDAAAIARWLVALASVRLVAGVSARRLLPGGTGVFALPLFFLLWAYLYWVWGVVAQLPANFLPVAVCAALACAVLFVFSGKKAEAESGEKKHWGSEIVFWAVLLSAFLIRSWAPSLDQTEKFTDMALFQSVLNARRFPPDDLWLSGLPLNYYYFGHLLFVPISKLTFLPAEWSFNLAVCTIAAMTGAIGYEIAHRLSRHWFPALGAAAAVMVLSNWEWMKQLAEGASLRSLSWWNSSRAIPGTITEFPYFSFLLGDFHAHYIQLPWFGLSLALLLALRSALRENRSGRVAPLAALTALSVGVHYPLNAWGLPAVALLAAALLGRFYRTTAAVGVMSLAWFAPYWFSYRPPLAAFHWVPVALRSGLVPFFLHWGLFLVPLLFWIAVGWRNVSFRKTRIVLAVTLAAALTMGIAAGLTVGIAACLWACGLLDPERPEDLLFIAAAFFIVLCEVVYSDVFLGAALLRMNTVFKFYMVAWWGLAIAVPVLLWRNRQIFFRYRFIGAAVLSCCALAGIVYPLAGTAAHSGFSAHLRTLDGMVYWEWGLPGERAAVEWLRTHSDPGDVLWEAWGPAYRHYARFSSFSGRPAVLGWNNHEWVWRRNGHELCDEREKEMNLLVSEPSAERLRAFFRKYNVRWAVVGKLEKEKYPPALLNLLETYSVAFSTPTTKIYSIN